MEVSRISLTLPSFCSFLRIGPQCDIPFVSLCFLQRVQQQCSSVGGSLNIGASLVGAEYRGNYDLIGHLSADSLTKIMSCAGV
jgi:hypothetical protein